MPTYADFFCDGFDSYAVTDEMEPQWVLDDGAANVGIGTSFFGGQRGISLRGTSITLVRFVEYSMPGASDYAVMGVRAHPLSIGGGSNRVFLGFRGAGGSGNRAYVVAPTGGLGDVEVRGGTVTGTLLLTVPGYILEDVEAFYEFEAYHHASNGFVALYRNGSLMGSFSGDTSSIGGTLGSALFRAPTTDIVLGDRTWFRDFYCARVTSWSTVGGHQFGPGVARDLPPNADVSADFTPSSGSDNYAMVSTIPNDVDTTHNESDTAGHEDLFTASLTSLPAGQIRAVGVFTNARQSEVGPLNFGAVMESGTERIAPAGIVMGPDYAGRLLLPMQLQDPDDGGAWDPTRLGNLRFGYRNVAP